MPDTSYGPKVYRPHGGDELVVASGGKIKVESGGDIEVNGDSLIDEIAALTGLDSGELGVLNGVTAGTIAASKVVVVDANKDAKSFRDIRVRKLEVDDSDASHPLIISATSDLSAARTLGIATGDVNRVLTLTGNATLTGGAKAMAINLYELRKAAALKDALGDSPDATALGLADAAGSVVTGTTTNGGVTASASETCAFQVALPDNYTDGAAITLRVRAKVSATRQVSQTVDAVVKQVQADGTLGSDINATAAINLTTSYADHDFTITPTGLVAGDLLNVVLTLATDDTGGAPTNGFPTISRITLLPTVNV